MEIKDITPEELNALQDNYSPDMKKKLSDRADFTASNWLFNFGMPEHPSDVRQLVHTVYYGAPAILVEEGMVTLTEDGQASEEEVEEAKALRAKLEEKRSYFTDLLQGKRDAEVATAAVGQYL